MRAARAALAFGLLTTGCGGVLTNDTHDGSADAKSQDVSVIDAGIDVAPWIDADVEGYMEFESDDVADASDFVANIYASATEASGGCVQTQAGPCTLYDCPEYPSGGDVSAGTLTISGGPLPNGGVTVSEGAPPFTQYSQAIGALTKGDALAVSASGAAVPAFAQSVTMVGGADLVAPVAPITISASQDLVVSWAGGEPGARFHFSLQAPPVSGDGGTFVKNVDCAFDAVSGAGTIPKAALGSMQGQAGVMAFWAHERDVRFWAGSYPLALSAMRFRYAPASVE